MYNNPLARACGHFEEQNDHRGEYFAFQIAYITFFFLLSWHPVGITVKKVKTHCTYTVQCPSPQSPLALR